MEYAKYSQDPEIRMDLIYNRSSVLLALSRPEEARASLLEVERMAKELPSKPICLEFLPFCQAEIDLDAGKETDIHALAQSFLSSPLQNRPELASYLLDEDEYLFSLLWKNNFKEDASLFLSKIEKIQKDSPSLRTAMFLARGKAALATDKGDFRESSEQSAELARLYEEEETEFSKDFEEITKLHFEFVRVSTAYRKAQKRAQRLREESDTDVLTSLANRRALEKEKKRFPVLAKKEPYFVLALLDFDHFKVINDTYGYQTGDDALRSGAQFFKTFESPTVRVFRYGGDEFIFALAVKSPKEAASFFQKLKEGLEAVGLVSQDGQKVPLSCCIGYALFKGSYTLFSPALKMANEAIHAAKNIGRGNIVSVVG